MIPAQIDFVCWSNSDYLEDIPVTDDGQPVDLTGLTVKMEVRRFPGGPLLFVATTSIDGNVISIVIEREKLNSPARDYSYDILVIHPDDFQEIYAQGVVSVRNGVTLHG